MLWLLFVFLAILIGVVVVFAPTLPVGLGYVSVILWIMLMIYIIFFRRDETSRIFEE